MILADTSVWIDHFRHHNAELAGLLNGGAVLMHPFIIGELALGHLAARTEIIRALKNLALSPMATDSEVRDLIDKNRLFGLGIGYIDIHLIAATRLQAGSRLWTFDKKLAAAYSYLVREN